MTGDTNRFNYINGIAYAVGEKTGKKKRGDYSVTHSTVRFCPKCRRAWQPKSGGIEYYPP